MARGKNIRSREKIEEALETIHSPFTSGEMASATGLGTHRVQGLLRSTKGVKKEYVNRSKGGVKGSGGKGRLRCQWMVVK